MKLTWVVALILMTANTVVASTDKRIYLLGKRQAVNSNLTHVAMFYDRGIDNMAACQKEIRRGYRGQWRYYHHSFPRPKGYSEKLNYYCIESDIRFNGWYKKDSYDYIYQIDIRAKVPKIKKMKDYATCLHDLRRYTRDEKPSFFCAKLSQKLRI